MDVDNPPARHRDRAGSVWRARYGDLSDAAPSRANHRAATAQGQFDADRSADARENPGRQRAHAAADRLSRNHKRACQPVSPMNLFELIAQPGLTKIELVKAVNADQHIDGLKKAGIIFALSKLDAAQFHNLLAILRAGLDTFKSQGTPGLEKYLTDLGIAPPMIKLLVDFIAQAESAHAANT